MTERSAEHKAQAERVAKVEIEIKAAKPEGWAPLGPERLIQQKERGAVGSHDGDHSAAEVLIGAGSSASDIHGSRVITDSVGEGALIGNPLAAELPFTARSIAARYVVAGDPALDFLPEPGDESKSPVGADARSRRRR